MEKDDYLDESRNAHAESVTKLYTQSLTDSNLEGICIVRDKDSGELFVSATTETAQDAHYLCSKMCLVLLSVSPADVPSLTSNPLTPGSFDPTGAS